VSYGRIEEAADLPPSGPLNARAREKADLDFKRFADPTRCWEHCKDIAAFANALGGVLLIGAAEHGGQLAYPGVRGQTADDVKTIYEGAAGLCSPAAVVDVVPIPQQAGAPVVAINVDPSVDAVVAAPARDHDRHGRERKHDIAWVFPRRVASQTEYLQPEVLPMYMNREVRRAVVLLSRIPTNKRRGLTVFYHAQRHIQNQHWDGVVQVGNMDLDLDEVRVDRNVAKFCAVIDNHGVQIRIPLLDILDVWEVGDSRWAVKVAGRLHRVQGAPTPRLAYDPMPR